MAWDGSARQPGRQRLGARVGATAWRCLGQPRDDRVALECSPAQAETTASLRPLATRTLALLRTSTYMHDALHEHMAE